MSKILKLEIYNWFLYNYDNSHEILQLPEQYKNYKILKWQIYDGAIYVEITENNSNNVD